MCIDATYPRQEHDQESALLKQYIVCRLVRVYLPYLTEAPSSWDCPTPMGLHRAKVKSPMTSYVKERSPHVVARVSLHWLANHHLYGIQSELTSSPFSMRKLPMSQHVLHLHLHAIESSMMPWTRTMSLPQSLAIGHAPSPSYTTPSLIPSCVPLLSSPLW